MALTTKELVVYIQAEGFEMSKRFYAALGFDLTEAGAARWTAGSVVLSFGRRIIT